MNKDTKIMLMALIIVLICFISFNSNLACKIKPCEIIEPFYQRVYVKFNITQIPDNVTRVNTIIYAYHTYDSEWIELPSSWGTEWCCREWSRDIYEHGIGNSKKNKEDENTN